MFIVGALDGDLCTSTFHHREDGQREGLEREQISLFLFPFVMPILGKGRKEEGKKRETGRPSN